MITDFVVPKGKYFQFYLNIREADSFIAQNLDSCDSANFTLLESDTLNNVFTEALEIVDSANGKVKGSIDSAVTDTLKVDRGNKEDNYYLKPTYKLNIYLTFSDDTPPITASIDKVYILPT